MKIGKAFYFVLISVTLVACMKNTENQSIKQLSGPVKVEIVKDDSGYQLLRDGQPYSFNGVGGSENIKNLKAHGGNSFRTWSVDGRNETGKEVLDKALANGMTVTMCIYVQPERHGMDYDSTEQVNAQFERIKEEVLAHKDHPALLMWCIGNEPNLNYTNPKVFDELNRISKWIHKVDPYHPTTTALASINPTLSKEIKNRAPDLDLLSIQVYGSLFRLQDMLKESEWEGPYMVTEWGAIGHWEVPSTEWGAPIEQNSSQKAANYLKGYQKSIEPYGDKCLGNYVFLWGQKQERTPTWYGLFLESGEETEAVDVMHYIWNGEWPENRTPRVDSLLLDGKKSNENIYLTSGETYPTEAYMLDVDGDLLEYEWEIRHESTSTKEGGDFEEKPEQLHGLFITSDQSKVSFKAPKNPGAYRLFVYAFDGNGHAAHANIPFYVKES